MPSDLPPLFFAYDNLVFFKATEGDCAGIRHCLSIYEKASGQLINFEKSSLSFSPNTAEVVANRIKSLLSISIAQGHDVYLGIPTFSMRNEKMQCRYLVDRVVKRLQGWGNKNYSSAEKETLIK